MTLPDDTACCAVEHCGSHHRFRLPQTLVERLQLSPGQRYRTNTNPESIALDPVSDDADSDALLLARAQESPDEIVLWVDDTVTLPETDDVDLIIDDDAIAVDLFCR